MQLQKLVYVKASRSALVLKIPLTAVAPENTTEKATYVAFERRPSQKQQKAQNNKYGKRWHEQLQL